MVEKNWPVLRFIENYLHPQFMKILALSRYVEHMNEMFSTIILLFNFEGFYFVKTDRKN